MDVLSTWLIRFTQPGALNDPFEMRPHVEAYGTPEQIYKITADRWDRHTESQFERLKKERGGNVSYVEFRDKALPFRESMIAQAIAKASDQGLAMGAKIDEMLNRDLGVLSLSAKYDDLLMWSHYTESHRGFVLEFDTGSTFFNQAHPPSHVAANQEEIDAFKSEYGFLRQVEYSDLRSSVVVTQLTFDHLLVKSKGWEYESEWRMLMPLDYADAKFEALEPYPVHLFMIPPAGVKRVILGCNSSNSLLAKAKALKTNPKTAHIVVERAEIDPKHFKLTFAGV